jgi:hypothetical protein
MMNRWFSIKFYILSLFLLVLLIASLLTVRFGALAQGGYLPQVWNNYSAPGQDCSVIQKAIDDLPEQGGVVEISGEYLCQTAIVIARDHVELRGSASSTILRLANNANAPVLVLGDKNTPPALHHSIIVSGLTIDGNRTQQQFECWGGACDSGGLTFIRNNGITVRGIEDALVENITIRSARSGGLVTERVVRRLTVRGLTSYDNFYDGLAAYQTEDSTFSNIFLHDNPFAGMSLDIGFNRNIISQAVLANNGKQGIFMRDSRDNLFQGIQIRNSGEQGLFLAQVDSDTSKPAAGNTFSGLVVSNSAGPGMRVNDLSCINNLVSGAQFINNNGCLSEAQSNLAIQSGVVCR